jgi:1-acyl-sn-glycerol-3-phosphate acyltransferase
LLYNTLKIIVRVAIRFFCRKVIINKPEQLQAKGPLLLACNHPNSFLDSVIINTLFEQPVWSLARGDVFKKPFYIRLLSALKILPVYRTSEGVENLSENYKTFEACIEIFRKNGIVTIFSEGKCINEWHLRPLKKGTARLAYKAWEEGIPLQVLPVGINYSSFRRFGKNVFLNFGTMISREDIQLSDPDGVKFQAFNNILEKQLKELVYEIPVNDTKLQREKLAIAQPLIIKIILFIPAIAGWLLHAPLYLLIRGFTKRRTFSTDHYDSVMTALLLFAYPAFLLTITISLLLLTKSLLWLSLFAVFPFTAWCFIRLKQQI